MKQALNPVGQGCPIEPGIMEGFPPAADGSVLSSPITKAEVVDALHASRNHKSTGASGCPTELLKYASLEDDDSDFTLPAESDVAEHLVRLLNLVFEAGQVPSDWHEVVVSPVFKRGDKTDMANYRPICVGDNLEMLYAVVSNARLWRRIACALLGRLASGHSWGQCTNSLPCDAVLRSVGGGNSRCMRASWIWQRRAILSLGICFGVSCKRLECPIVSFLLCNPCMRMFSAE